MRHIFTFGCGHECKCGLSLSGCYTVIDGDWAESRARMVSVWGLKWSMQYPNETAAGVEEYELVKIETNASDPDRCPCGRTSTLEDDEITAMLWFGESWDAPICTLASHIKTPVGERCFKCSEPIYANDQGYMLAHIENTTVKRYPWHRECMAASILGPNTEENRGTR